MSTSPDDKEKIAWLEGRIQQLTGAANIGTQPSNIAFSTFSTTTNGQGNTGSPAIVAMILLQSKYSGVFRWSASAVQAAAAATEVVTWAVTTQTSAAFPTLAGAGNGDGAATFFGPGAAPSSQVFVSNGVAGTPITISAGLGGEVTQYSGATTIGTLAVGSAFATGGVLWNSASTAATTLTPPTLRTAQSFPLNNWVALILKITNSATNRIVNSINMSLEELRF